MKYCVYIRIIQNFLYFAAIEGFYPVGGKNIMGVVYALLKHYDKIQLAYSKLRVKY